MYWYLSIRSFQQEVLILIITLTLIKMSWQCQLSEVTLDMEGNKEAQPNLYLLLNIADDNFSATKQNLLDEADKKKSANT